MPIQVAQMPVKPHGFLFYEQLRRRWCRRRRHRCAPRGMLQPNEFKPIKSSSPEFEPVLRVHISVYSAV